MLLVWRQKTCLIFKLRNFLTCSSKVSVLFSQRFSSNDWLALEFSFNFDSFDLSSFRLIFLQILIILWHACKYLCGFLYDCNFLCGVKHGKRLHTQFTCFLFFSFRVKRINFTCIYAASISRRIYILQPHVKISEWSVNFANIFAYRPRVIFFAI